MLRILKISALIWLTAFACVQATIIYVPSDYPLIQSAINSSHFGDTVLVAPGTYLENLVIDGHNILLTSNFMFSRSQSDIENTIIDGNWIDRVIVVSGVNTGAIIKGFTIENGRTTGSGGGMYVNQSWAAISNNIIRRNECGGDGGGIQIFNGIGTVEIDHNYISYNRSLQSNGGGISGSHSNIKIENNIILQNFAMK